METSGLLQVGVAESRVWKEARHKCWGEHPSIHGNKTAEHVLGDSCSGVIIINTNKTCVSTALNCLLLEYC